MLEAGGRRQLCWRQKAKVNILPLLPQLPLPPLLSSLSPVTHQTATNAGCGQRPTALPMTANSDIN
jgi:hypothetical protein